MSGIGRLYKAWLPNAIEEYLWTFQNAILNRERCTMQGHGMLRALGTYQLVEYQSGSTSSISFFSMRS